MGGKEMDEKATERGEQCVKVKVWERYWVELVARVTIVLFGGVAAVLMGTDHDTHVFIFGPISIRISAHYKLIRALVFFVYGNAIVAIYSILVIVAKYLFMNKYWTIWLTFGMDQLMAYMLVALLGASIEVVYIAKHGEDKVQWSELCSNYNHFCTLAGISLLSTIIVVLVMVTLVISSSRQFFSYGKIKS